LSVTTPTLEPIDAGGVVLDNVPWDVYVELRAIEENRHVRMTYLDGTLVIMSPEFRHERGAVRTDLIILAVARANRVPLISLRTSTLKKLGRRPNRGEGKEGDNAYYVGPNAERLRGRRDIEPITGGDGPPDLVVEVVNKSDSPLALPIYTRFGVPEVWWYDARDDTLNFRRLDLETGECRESDRSIALPLLTPARVLEALAAGVDQDEMTRSPWLDDWAARLA
jgi:Uma2 family endonuclease